MHRNRDLKRVAWIQFQRAALLRSGNVVIYPTDSHSRVGADQP